MWSKRLEKLLALLLANGGMLGMACANPLEALQGAWAMHGVDCTAIFENTAAGAIRFKERNSSLNAGIIVAGDRVVASTASCSVVRLSETDDHFSVLMNCADSILLDSVRMTFRVIDETHFERIDPDFPGFALEFNKCQF